MMALPVSYTHLPEKVPLNVEFFGPDSLGQMSMLKVLTTDIDKNTYTIRGYDPKPVSYTHLDVYKRQK